MNMNKSPNEGGCWFCHTDDGEMHFSTEFDTYFHMDCLEKELTKRPHNPEAEIIADEFGVPIPYVDGLDDEGYFPAEDERKATEAFEARCEIIKLDWSKE